MTGQVTNQKTLDTLITSDIQSAADKVLNNPWRGAEAWHFVLLAQKQLYRGEYPSALKTARRLVEYELELDLKKIYSILTLAGYYARNYQECSRALVKLESMECLTPLERQQYETIAVEIFTNHLPDESNEEFLQCMGKYGVLTVRQVMRAESELPGHPLQVLRGQLPALRGLWTEHPHQGLLHLTREYFLGSHSLTSAVLEGEF